MRSLFADPSRIDEAWYEAAADDFLRTWRSPRARMAFFAALRHIYLEEPYGEKGMFTRLRSLETRSLYIYGRHDVLITPLFARKIARVVPGAQVELWDDSGHAPQLEHPLRTADAIEHFLNGDAQASQAG
jgi:pimeloyl-ACP methyl ester carboxylesterase